MRFSIAQYLLNLLVALDQAANALLAGDPDETISSRVAKRRASCRFCAGLCWLLDKLDARHCARHTERDEGRNAALTFTARKP